MRLQTTIVSVPLLFFPPVSALWDGRRSGGAIHPCDRIFLFACRTTTSTGLLPLPIREEELCNDDSVQEPESPHGALPKPGLDKQEAILGMLVWQSRSLLGKQTTSTVGVYYWPQLCIHVRLRESHVGFLPEVLGASSDIAPPTGSQGRVVCRVD